MNQPISITVTSPFVTIDKFSEISGLPIDTIRGKIQKGELKIRKKTRRNEKVMINMISLAQEALQN